ncbi:MAG: zinc-dependent metalloprotease, partial [Stackebrandtia sp.]
MTQFVDWELAAATARRLGRSGPAMGLEEAVDVVARLREYADAAAGHVGEFTGLRPPTPPSVRVVDRAAWA